MSICNPSTLRRDERLRQEDQLEAHAAPHRRNKRAHLSKLEAKNWYLRLPYFIHSFVHSFIQTQNLTM